MDNFYIFNQLFILFILLGFVHKMFVYFVVIIIYSIHMRIIIEIIDFGGKSTLLKLLVL